MNKLRLLLAVIIVAAVLSIALAWVLPVPTQLASTPDEFRAAFGVANFTNILSISTAILFLVGLGGFKREFKKAYYFICSGLLIQVWGTLVYSILSYVLPVERNLWGDLPITAGSLLMFLGVWRLARVVGVRSLLVNPWVILAYLLVISGMLWFIPHPVSDLSIAVNQANHVLEALFYPLGTLLLWQVIRTVSPTYARSFIWLAVAFAGNFIAAALFIGKGYVAYPAWASDELLGVLFIIDTFIYVAAGYSFASIEYRLSRRQTANSTIDIVVFVAALASQPKEIDPFLDKLRAITTKVLPNQPLTQEQEKQLADIYTQLENYLVTKETLRSFTKGDIRSRVQRTFERLPMGITLDSTDQGQPSS